MSDRTQRGNAQKYRFGKDEAMSSQQNTVDFICDQMAGAGDILSRKMFGEYGVYCDDKFIGVICDDILFLKPTPAGLKVAPDLKLVAAYDGAKPSRRIPQELIENTHWLVPFVRLTHDNLPAKKKNAKRSQKAP